MKVECNHCKNEWDYKGKYLPNPKAMVTCPACGLRVKLYICNTNYEMDNLKLDLKHNGWIKDDKETNRS